MTPRPTAPVLAAGHGALGFWKAVREVFPATREQRCWFRKQANVLSCLPKPTHPGAVAAMREIYHAEDIDHAQVALKAFEVDYGANYPRRSPKSSRRRRGPGVVQVPRRAAAEAAGETRPGINAYGLLRGIGNLCVGAEGDARYDARQL